ncbi:MAG: molybdopterin-synthase adenylyltransferase MoeB [Gammaproteobacteria bacterium]|nr:MAG: molybdopterin-synthase adenylyltransferase MoeB [Gammaproteobacteria bacterium]
MDDDQLLRYSRQILLTQIGAEGQQRLLDASVLIVGAGGLGCPAAMYLAAGGVSHIIVADHDKVDLSNLQRQIAHTTADIGHQKTDSLKNTLSALNPNCRIDTIDAVMDEEKLSAAVANADLVLDCTDNFATRFIINETCVNQHKPLVSGAAIRFEAQVMVYNPADENSPCYRCLYPDMDAAEETCSENGVIAPLVGIIGSMQALESMKLLMNTGQILSGRLLILDALVMQWRELKVQKDNQCPVCQKV